MEQCIKEQKSLEVIITIVDRGKGNRVTELFNEQGFYNNIVCLGRGTATSEILDYLGLGETEKDVVISTVLQGRDKELLGILERELNLNKPGNGIAFTLSIKSVGGQATLQFMTSLLREDRRDRDDK